MGIKRNFIYNPERVKEVKRLYQEFASRAILRIIEKEEEKEKENVNNNKQEKVVV